MNLKSKKIIPALFFTICFCTGCLTNQRDRASQLLESGDYLGARQLFESWVKKHPTDHNGHYGLGMSWCAEAIFKSELGISQAQDWYKPIYYISRSLHLGSGPEAQTTLAVLHYNLGAHYHKSGSVELAITRLEQAIVYDSTLLKAVNLLGALYHDQGNVAMAERCYLKATRIEPGYALPYFNLGALSWANGEFEKSYWYFNEAQLRDPNNEHFIFWAQKAKSRSDRAKP